jgi:hemolysin III
VKILSRFKHPFSGLSHLFGAALSLVGVAFLLWAAWGDPARVAAFAVYGVSLVFLYAASGLYHLLRLPPRHEETLYGLDRAAIYGLIAGTYTPICLIALPRAWGWPLLAVVWGLAVVGILADILSRRRAPDWLQAILYLLTGWAVLAALGPLVRSLPLPALLWLGAGCLIYTVGAVICVTDRPRLRPGIFGAHDLWHVLVLAGSVCHFVVMLRYVAPL